MSNVLLLRLYKIAQSARPWCGILCKTGALLTFLRIVEHRLHNHCLSALIRVLTSKACKNRRCCAQPALDTERLLTSGGKLGSQSEFTTDWRVSALYVLRQMNLPVAMTMVMTLRGPGVRDQEGGASYQISEHRALPAITEAGSGVLWRDRR